MRDCVFLVADKNIQAVFQGLFARPDWHTVFECKRIEIDTRPSRDLIVAAGQNDSGLFKRGEELLRPFLSSHAHALVVLDVAWDGSPGKQKIERKLAERLFKNGWTKEQAAVIAIEPEIDRWVWIDDPILPQRLGFEDLGALRSWFQEQGYLESGQNKPQQPKEALEAWQHKFRKPRSSALYERIVRGATSLKGCDDPAFLQLKAHFARWFSMESKSISHS